jgi:Tfp pilus assembly protein PilO
MMKQFAQLRPFERRMMLGVAVALFIFLNYVFVWPHFGDWGDLNNRYNAASQKLRNYQSAIDQKPTLERQLKQFENEGQFVAPSDQSINFLRAIQQQAGSSGVQILNTSRQITYTNDAFFIKQVQNINVSATEEQLVKFLYQLGNDPAMIRVSDLELQPDTSHMRLSANVKLVASYQKNPGPGANAGKNSTAMAK